jgi:2,3-dihydroxyphenylpropionate 1,2-dioxygenase
MSIKLKCLSHTPLRGLNDPGADVTREVDAILAKSRAEVEAFDPELIVVFAPDHYNGLFYDLMPPFVIATAADSVADYQTLPGPLSVDKDLALEMAKFILDSDLDIAISHRLQVDHGCTQTLEELTGSLTRYPVIPIIINSVAPPFGPYRRIRKLGEAVGKFVAKLNKRVLILGTGGLSHEPPVPLLAERAGRRRQFPDRRAQPDAGISRCPPGPYPRHRQDLRYSRMRADAAQHRVGPGLHGPAGGRPPG